MLMNALYYMKQKNYKRAVGSYKHLQKESVLSMMIA